MLCIGVVILLLPQMEPAPPPSTMRLNISLIDAHAVPLPDEHSSSESGQATAAQDSTQHPPHHALPRSTPPLRSQPSSASGHLSTEFESVRPIEQQILGSSDVPRVVERQIVTHRTLVSVAETVTTSSVPVSTQESPVKQRAVVHSQPEAVSTISQPVESSEPVSFADTSSRLAPPVVESSEARQHAIVHTAPPMAVTTLRHMPPSERMPKPIQSTHETSAATAWQDTIPSISDAGGLSPFGLPRTSEGRTEQSTLSSVPAAAALASMPPDSPDSSQHSLPAPGAGHAQKPSDDYRWVAQALWEGLIRLKQYPQFAHASRLEGVVLVRATVEQDGRLGDVTLIKSSGHQSLDSDALDLVRRVGPLSLQSPLDRPQVVVTVPVRYKLN